MANKHDEYIQQIADDLIEQIKNNNAPWQKPWTGAEAMLPVNHQGNYYHGVNVLKLLMQAQKQGYSDNRWYTYNNAKEAGGQVRRGEKGTGIMFFVTTKRVDKTDEHGNLILDDNGKPVKEEIKLDRPRVVHYTLFNAEQIDGLPKRDIPPKLEEWERHAKAELIIEGIKAQGLTIEHKPIDRAFYRSSTDTIVIPERGQFETADRYYATLLHEIGHATGHESRLNRDLSGAFGSTSYAKEELRAEISSMLIGQQLQIGHDPSQHAAYLESWIKVVEEDPKEIFRAVKDADKITNYLLGISTELEYSHNSIETRTQWGDFPPVISNGKLGDLKKEPEYLEAKSGDIQQSAKLVEKLLKQETIDRIRMMVGNESPVIVPILSEEATGKNRIPQATAYALASNLGLEVDNNIYQDNTVKRTGTGIYHRYVAPPEFRGEVERGQSYLIVDDTLSVGGTIATLKGYIENRGGKVVGATVMTAYDSNVDIAIKQNMLQSLREKQGLSEYWNKEFGYNLDKLTQQEAGHLKKPTLEQIQDRVQEARKLLRDNQHETENRTEQQPLHSTFEADRKTASRTNRSQQERSGVLQGVFQQQEELEKTYLYVPFEDKDRAKALGARWDNDVKSWYVPEGIDITKFKAWEKPPVEPHINPELEFTEFLESFGANVKSLRMDGSFHRVHIAGDKSSKLNGSYVGWLDGGKPRGYFKNFKTGEEATWISQQKAVSVKTPAELEQAKHEAQAKQQARYDQVALSAKLIFDVAPLATTHPYLKNKGVNAHNLRLVPDPSQIPTDCDIKIAHDWQQAKVMRDSFKQTGEYHTVLTKGDLIIPAFDKDNKLTTFQTISSNGFKSYLKDGQKSGSYLILGEAKNNNPILIAEGYATAATLYEQLNRPVAVAFDSGNLKATAEAIRENYPDSAIYLMADNDHITEAKTHQNAGLTKAKEASEAINGYVVYPKFETNDPGSDWNDLYHSKGVDELKQQIRSQLHEIRYRQRLDMVEYQDKTMIQEAIHHESKQQEIISRHDSSGTTTAQHQPINKKDGERGNSHFATPEQRAKNQYDATESRFSRESEFLKFVSEHSDLKPSDKKVIEQWVDELHQRYSNHPDFIAKKLEDLNAKIPDIASGKVNLPSPQKARDISK